MKTLARALALIAAPLALSAAPLAAQAQTWGQPVYGVQHGGSPLSEIQTRAYAETGRNADGYADYGYGPQPYYGGYGHERSRYGHGRRYGQTYGFGRYHAPSQPGYRDEWGYNDDRPPSRWRDNGYRDNQRYARRDCDCRDVYLYDR